MEYQIDIANQVLIFIIFAVSLNILMGYAGQASIAHAAFGAVGGYVAAYLSAKLGVSFFPSLLAGIGGALVVGTLISIPALRLSTEYIILLTLAISYIVIAVIDSSGQLGGTYGLLGIRPVEIFGHAFLTPSALFVPILILTLLVIGICWRLGESPLGRVLKAIREDEVAARSLGKNVYAYKVVIFGVTAGMAGLAGSLLVFYNQLASPALFSVDQSIAIIAMVVFGGTGNLLGSILGAALIIVSAPVLEHTVRLDPSTAALLRLAIYGFLLVVLMRLRPEGIVPEGAGPIAWLRALGSRHGTPAPADLSARGHTLQSGSVPSPATARTASIGSAGSIGAYGTGHVSREDPPRFPALPITHDANEASADDKRDHILIVKDLKKSFGGITAVDGLSLELPERCVTGLIGPNGAGKTTVFGILTGFIPPDAGLVFLRGQNIVGKRPDELVKLGLVRSFQDVRLFRQMTVLQNVMLAIPHQPGENVVQLFVRPFAVLSSERGAREEALRYLDFVGLRDKADWKCEDLAFAEQKLVAIARVLATNAEILLLDEPTSGVDPRSVDQIAAAIRDLPQLGKTVCIVEHNLSFLEKIGCPCYFMENGRVTAYGRISEMMADERLKKAYFGV